MAAPTPAQVQLIRDYEPALYFWGNPGDPDVERFFPSNAKRYVEKAALRLATTTSSYDWTTPIINADRISATEGEGGTGAVFIGERNSSGVPLYLEAPGKQLFLDVSGWKPGDQHSDLDKLAARYAPGGDLNDSQFWYHAEFFDKERLLRLFADAIDPGGEAINFAALFDRQGGDPPFMIDPALICYYLFYPGHEESLDSCTDDSGLVIPSARDFSSFAGEWSCIAILLDRATPTDNYVPKYVGLSNRNVGIVNVGGQEIRSTMRLRPWGAMRTYAGNHPRFNVAKGTHALYVEGEPIPALMTDDPGAKFCGSATPLTGPGDTYVTSPIAPLVTIAKVLAGAAAGGVLGPIGAAVGAAAGLASGIAESEDLHLRYIDTTIIPGLGPTVDSVSASGFVVHPVGLRPDDALGQVAEWRSADGVVGAEGRVYDFTVDRIKQVLWGKDPEGLGYTGRWGQLVRDDPQTRRAGMVFPKFWHLFFDALVRDNLPATVVMLTKDTSWTVPADWNNANNTIEAIGGGGGGAGGNPGAVTGGGAGGGGEYRRVANVTLTPGATISYAVGVGGSGGAAGADGADGGNTIFDTSTLIAVGGKRGTSATGLGGDGGTGGTGAAASFNGGAGGGGGGLNVSNGGGGGGGAAGPNGAGGLGLNGGVRSGGGGGGNGGGGNGLPGSNVTPSAGGAGGPAQNRTAGGVGGTIECVQAGPGLHGSGGGGGAATSGPCAFGGAMGGNGIEYGVSFGSGGGGGGGGASSNASTANKGGDGGQYGAGGGGGSQVQATSAAPGGTGAPGLIIIRYTPQK